MAIKVTIGQYYNTDSIIHRMDPRFKIVLAVTFMLVLVVAKSWAGLACLFAFLTAAVLMTRVPLGKVVGSLKPVVGFLVFTFVAYLFFERSGVEILHLGPASITDAALWSAIILTLRLLVLFMATAMLGFTTSPIDLSDAVESLLSPFARFGMPAHEIGMMMSIALRFIPTLVDEADKIMKAQTARGADFETGNLLARAKAIVPLLTPLFVSAFRHAEELAIAMESRCYHGREGRTRVRELKARARDWAAAGATAVLVAALIAIRVTGI
ncbi:MAG: energy-coupling factor transporter transmembrane protein EcfT [Coriobacteriia bacterium]|nr:energy-coupling factor transporter transmembrane protein EcfT [Coriobacteriia bacterium]